MSARGEPSAESRTRRWLTDRFRASLVERDPSAPPVFDATGRPTAMTPYAFRRLLRKLKLLRCLEELEFGSFIDVASGWEHVPYLVRERYGAEAYYSEVVHELNLPVDGEHYGKVDHAITLKLPVLPFRDDAFDVVLCSEVLEHLVRPLEAITEMLRVARRYLVLTSLEALSVNRWQRWLSHHRVDVRVSHVERNFFLLPELASVFGHTGLHTENLLFDDTLPLRLFETPAKQAAAYARIDTRDALETALCRAVSEGRHGTGAFGILVVKAKPGAAMVPPSGRRDRELAGWLIDQAIEEERFAEIALAVWAAFQADPSKRPKDERDRVVAADLLARLQCPDCRGTLAVAPGGVRCDGCGRHFRSDYGIPILGPTDELAGPSEDECVVRLCGDDAARGQVVRRLMQRLRRNERPPGLLRRAAWRLERPFVGVPE